MKYIISIFTFICILVFASCEITNTNNTKEVYLGKGKLIASATFATLSSNLQKAMKKGGVTNAVQYCSLKAFPLTDSLSQVHQAAIKRTSLKTRNHKNKPTKLELEQLYTYQKQLEAGKEIKPLIKEIDEQTIAFYAPIEVMPLCQKCHGKLGETLASEDYKVIQQLYPEDEAIGYATGDWRGMWSISFKK